MGYAISLWTPPALPITGSSEWMTSAGMRAMLQAIRSDFQSWTVILDLPPVLVSDDVIGPRGEPATVAIERQARRHPPRVDQDPPPFDERPFRIPRRGQPRAYLRRDLVTRHSPILALAGRRRAVSHPGLGRRRPRWMDARQRPSTE